jgi:hypothetical protein
MALGDAIFDRLSNDEAVTELVADRIEPDISSSEEFPFVVYTIERDPDNTLSRNAVTHRHSVTISITAESRAQANATAAAIKDSLDDESWVTGETKVVAVTFLGQTIGLFTDGEDVETILYTVEQTYGIFADN